MGHRTQFLGLLCLLGQLLVWGKNVIIFIFGQLRPTLAIRNRAKNPNSSFRLWDSCLAFGCHEKKEFSRQTNSQESFLITFALWWCDCSRWLDISACKNFSSSGPSVCLDELLSCKRGQRYCSSGTFIEEKYIYSSLDQKVTDTFIVKKYLKTQTYFRRLFMENFWIFPACLSSFRFRKRLVNYLTYG